MRQEIGQADHGGRGGGGVRFEPGSGSAGRGLSVGAVRRFRRRRPQAPRLALPFANEGDARAPQSAARPRSGYSGGSQAYCVRTCDGRYFPISGVQRPEPRRVVQQISARPAKPKVVYGSNIDMRQPRAESPIRSCRMRFAIATNWSQGAPATARTRSVWRRSRSRTIATLRKGDIVAGADGLVVAGHAADKRGASLNFSPASERCVRAISVCRWWRPE